MKQSLIILSILAANVASAAVGDVIYSSTKDTMKTDGKNVITLALPSDKSIKMVDGFTLTFDVKFVSSDHLWDTLLAFGESSSYTYRLDYGQNVCMWDFNSDSTGNAYSVSNRTTGDGKFSISGETAITCTLVMDAADLTGTAPSSRLSFYVDGELAASAMVTATTYGGTGNPGTVNYISFGGSPQHRKIKAEFSNIVLQAGAVHPAVPEPATATLSLLALAGLAARRRRK